MMSRIKRCLAAAVGAAWLLVPAAHAEGAKLAAKEMPSTTTAPAGRAAPPRVSPYAKYARAHAKAHKGAINPRVSILSMQRSHRVAGRQAH